MSTTDQDMVLTKEVEHSLLELIFFMTTPNPKLREVAVSQMFACTGNSGFITFFRKYAEAVEAFMKLIRIEKQAHIKKDAFNALINLSSDSIVVENLIANDLNNCCVAVLISYIMDENTTYGNSACIILANLTRASEKACGLVISMNSHSLAISKEQAAKQAKLNPTPKPKQSDKKEDTPDKTENKIAEISENNDVEAGDVIYNLLNIFVNEKYNKNGQNLAFLSPLFSNLSQTETGRSVILNRKRFTFQRLLTYTRHADTVRRGGVVGMIRNCTFDTDVHKWLLGEEVDILPFLLYPLAGPEELEEEDMDGMPDELQYLPDDKERESDVGIEKMLLDSLLQLCATPHGRAILRKKKAYPILRELYTAREETPMCKPVHDVIQILIGDDSGKNLRTEVEVKPEFAVENEEFSQIENEVDETVKLQSMFGDGLTISLPEEN